jgi:hypothetical protein
LNSPPKAYRPSKMAMNLGGWSRVQVPGFFQLAGAINRLAPLRPQGFGWGRATAHKPSAPAVM